MQEIEAVTREFDIDGVFRSAEPWGSGHINASFAVTMEESGSRRRYLVQRMNRHVFPDPPAVMENIRRVTDHLRARLRIAGAPDASRRALTLVRTRDGAVRFRDAGGDTWRAFPFIEGARTHDIVRSAGQAREGAFAYGRFQRLLDDLPAPRLTETLPGFHDTPARFAALMGAVEADPAGRVRDVGPEIDFARAREASTHLLEDARAAGEMPERVTHNDTKINNVLFDEETGEGICVIDLDTVMPGLALYDFGDYVRTCVSPAAEDERDLSKVCVRPRIYDALVEGYLDAIGPHLTATETELLPESGRLITFELGLRFLTDHLEGDTYFRIHRPRQNLDRCRVQFALVRRLEEAKPGS